MKPNLSSLDLNLILTLAAILEERNLTKAAARLHVTQSAVSQALKKLRDILGDSLLTRSPSGLILTPRAEELLPQISAAINHLEMVFASNAEFDPLTATRTYRIVATDYCELTILPILSKALEERAPGMSIHLTQSNARIPHAEIVKGEVDLVLGFFPEYPADFYQRKLFTEEFVTCMRSDHELTKEPLTLEKFIQAKHILVSPWGGAVGLVDDLLAEQSMSRRVSRWVPHFQTVPHMLTDSDFISTLPRRVVERFEKLFSLVIIPTPVTVPSFGVFAFWHERTNRNPADIWLRNLLYELAQSL